jgi:hypothetical protein
VICYFLQQENIENVLAQITRSMLLFQENLELPAIKEIL